MHVPFCWFRPDALKQACMKNIGIFKTPIFTFCPEKKNTLKTIKKYSTGNIFKLQIIYLTLFNLMEYPKHIDTIDMEK